MQQKINLTYSNLHLAAYIEVPTRRPLTEVAKNVLNFRTMNPTETTSGRQPRNIERKTMWRDLFALHIVVVFLCVYVFFC